MLYILEVNVNDFFLDDVILRIYYIDICRCIWVRGLEIFRLYNIFVVVCIIKGDGFRNDFVIVRIYGEGKWIVIC